MKGNAHAFRPPCTGNSTGTRLALRYELCITLGRAPAKPSLQYSGRASSPSLESESARQRSPPHLQSLDG